MEKKRKRKQVIEFDKICPFNKLNDILLVLWTESLEGHLLLKVQLRCIIIGKGLSVEESQLRLHATRAKQ